MPSHRSPMRVLQVITDTDRRGAQVFATDLGEGLSALGFHVTTVALVPGTRSPALEVRTLGRTARGFGTLRALRAAMREADVTIAHGSSTLLACALAGLGRRRPFVYRQISDSRFWAPSWHRRLRVAAYLRLPRHIVALADSSATTLVQYLGVAPREVTVVPNAVPGSKYAPPTPVKRAAARAALGIPADGLSAVYVGALVPEKGVDTAIEAIAAAPDTRLVIVGDGAERTRLHELADQLAPGRVHFLGDRADPSPAYTAADLMLFPSKGGDSMPAVLIEAGLCGLPAITCPVGAIADVVVHRRTGLVVPSGDTAAVAEALRTLGDADVRQRLGHAAEQHCRERFTIEMVAPQWAEVLTAAAPGI